MCNSRFKGSIHEILMELRLARRPTRYRATVGGFWVFLTIRPTYPKCTKNDPSESVESRNPACVYDQRYSYRFLGYSKLGANASRLNLRSPPPASSSLFRKAFTPSCSALSVNTSSSSASFPRFNGPFRDPSSSHRLFSADLMKATKCRSTEAVADSAAVSPWDAADSCADAIAGVFSSRRARGSGARGTASVIRFASGVSGA